MNILCTRYLLILLIEDDRYDGTSCRRGNFRNRCTDGMITNRTNSNSCENSCASKKLKQNDRFYCRFNHFRPVCPSFPLPRVPILGAGEGDAHGRNLAHLISRGEVDKRTHAGPRVESVPNSKRPHPLRHFGYELREDSFLDHETIGGDANLAPEAKFNCHRPING